MVAQSVVFSQLKVRLADLPAKKETTSHGTQKICGLGDGAGGYRDQPAPGFPVCGLRKYR
jgi:hypothetical protein